VISIFSFRYIIESLHLCQVLVSHFVTLTEDSAASGSKSSRIVIQRLGENLYYAGKHGECYVLVGTQEQDFFSKYKEKKLNIP
jgi:hypothetical protein